MESKENFWSSRRMHEKGNDSDRKMREYLQHLACTNPRRYGELAMAVSFASNGMGMKEAFRLVRSA